MHSLWTPLRLSLHLSCSPPLLIKYDFRPSSYTIHVTDLTYIWTEHLDRKQILRRALSLDTSIDPSEDAGQMEQFLRHVQDSLRGTRSTKLSLIQGDAPKHLVLNTFTSLPAPLEPLQWPIYLAPAGQNVFTGEFVLPYLSQQLNAKAQIESLLQQLKDKDHVISRMTDKMQSDGLDFSKVFPSAAVSKARNRLDSRESVARLVKGLGEFDEEQWRSGFASQNRSLEDVVSGIFTPGAFEFANVTFKSSDFDQWWDHVEDDRNSEDREGREDLIARRGAEHNVETAKDKSDPNPEFQVRDSCRTISEVASSRLTFIRDSQLPRSSRPHQKLAKRLSWPTKERNGEQYCQVRRQSMEIQLQMIVTKTCNHLRQRLNLRGGIPL